MTTNRKTTRTPDAKPKITIERTFKASLYDMWDLWTTKRGIESWWGPEGFATTVRKLDVREGGELEYVMRATERAQIEFLEVAGMPTTSILRGRYTEVAPRTRLAYEQLADFIPGVEPYDVATRVAFHPVAGGIRMVVTLDTMHDAHWTKMMEMGWNSQLERLAKALEA